VTADRDTTLTPHVCEAITSVQAHTWAAAHRRMFDSPESVAARAALESAILSAIREAREDEESLKVAERLQKERWIARAEGVERALSRAESERDALAAKIREMQAAPRVRCECDPADVDYPCPCCGAKTGERCLHLASTPSSPRTAGESHE
jgi:hypothetical protein